MIKVIIRSSLIVIFLLATEACAFLLRRNQPAHGCRSTATQLGISEALGRYIDEEYYRQNHKHEYNMNWVRINKQAILYHTHDGDLVLGDPHIDFHTAHSEVTRESPQHYVASHPRVFQKHVCDVQKTIMSLRPREFMRECHDCINRRMCPNANAYYEAILAPQH